MHSPVSVPPTPMASVGSTVPTFSPAVILRALRKNWVFIVVGLALAMVGSVAYTGRQTKIYEPAATVQFDPQPLMPLGIQPGSESGPESFWSNQEYFATQHQILTSRKVASLVVRKLGLQR